ncbi:MAG: single-stranded-DNA-specific exonuclease RecJ [Capsulimonadales bacterium]|nr:single-stranded-DNA-specific exonuclease RecJ [Capsulimonadales bacterium]
MENDVIWQLNEDEPGAAEAISAALGVSRLTAVLLLRRDIRTPEAADAFLNPCLDDLFDPMLLPDMETAVARLNRAIDSGETIFLHGDYDADGVTSTALGLRALSAMGANVIPHIPRRSDGYDLQIVGVEKAKEKGASLILTADCGTRAVAAVERANELGLDVLITDHHRPGEMLPPALAIVNPYREDAEIPFRSLCGAGVLFKLMDALIGHRRPTARRSFRMKYLDLVALGTVADMTPLVGENRILVSHGLRTLTETTKKGLRTLLQSLKLEGKPVTAENIGWSIGPCLNAAGRMEEAELAFRLLVTGDADEAEQLTAHLAALREQSKTESARVTTEALTVALSDEFLSDRVLVLARERWGKGVIGIAANRVVEACRRPVILLAYSGEIDAFVGSARSFGGFPLHTALAQCDDLLARYGGHSQAAGVTVAAANLEAFRQRMNEIAAEYIEPEPGPVILPIDAEITDGRALTLGFIEQLSLLEPYGCDNPEPTFMTRGVEIIQVRRVGQDRNTFQADLLLPGSDRPLRAVWFRNGERADGLSVGEEIDIAYSPKVNEWRGSVTVQIQLKDIKPRR